MSIRSIGLILAVLALTLAAGCGNTRSTRNADSGIGSADGAGGAAEHHIPDSTVSVQIEQDLPRHILPGRRDSVASFYELRSFSPAWITGGNFNDAARDLHEALMEAGTHGLDPEQYLPDSLRNNPRAPETATSAARLDLLLTDAFLAYVRDMRGDRYPDRRTPGEWSIHDRPEPGVHMLAAALRSGALSDSLDTLVPEHRQYSALSADLSRYRGIRESGGWPTLKTDRVLHPGDSTAAAERIARRLRIEGYGSDSLRPDSVYSRSLAAVVYTYQQTNGLTPDSLMGPETRNHLNRPVEERIHTIELNLDRWRRFSDELNDRFIMVNIPEFQLRAYDDGGEALTMGVVIGKSFNDRNTPVFTDQMEYLIFSPYWNIPLSIAREEIIPKARGNRTYLVNNNYQIVSNYGPHANVLDVDSTDLDRVASGELKLRQKPGPGNALGGVKFMFPNQYAVYLHDTPADHLFERVERDFSHGCIRVEHPVELAHYALPATSEWTPGTIREQMWNDEWRLVELEEHIPVYILYFTARTTENGHTAFYDDLYGLDDELIADYS